MKFVKHTDKDIVEVYLIDDEDKILLTDSFQRIKLPEDIAAPQDTLIQSNEDLLLGLTIQQMIKVAVKKKMFPINEINEVGVKTIKSKSKKAEIIEDFK